MLTLGLSYQALVKPRITPLGAKLFFATKSPFCKGGFRGNVDTWSFLPSIS